jgi:hypothetical protein
MANSTTVEIILSESIDYAHKGNQVNSEILTLCAPNSTSKHVIAGRTVKQMFMRALRSLSGQSSGSDQDTSAAMNPTPEEVMTMVYMSDVDINMFMSAVDNLLTNGCALIGGEEPVTSDMLNKMENDRDKIVGTFLTNFLVGSFLKAMNENG